MQKLSVIQAGKTLFSIPLDKSIYRIGRQDTADICIPDSHVSRDHALLLFKDGAWWLEDTSKNGILKSDRSPWLGRSRWATQDILDLSKKTSIVLEEIRSKSDTKTILLPRQPTQLIHLDSDQEKVIIGRALLEFQGTDSNPIKLEIGPSGVTIGNHPSNDIHLSSPLVSRFHALIEKDKNEYKLIDLNSTNGTWINDLRITESHLTQSTDIKIGDVLIHFKIVTEEQGLSESSSQKLIDLTSDHPRMRKVFSLIEVTAPTDASIYIHGETGTGKELVAQAIHKLSVREHKPFIAINCAALPKELAESELFGHEKGSFTGAHATQVGAFEAADGGTLFLDEIGELDLSLQAKLLRALEAQEIKRIGSQKTKKISLRLVTASHKNLSDEVAKGRFRQDLYYRLNVVAIKLPALRDRLSDLPLLCRDLLKQIAPSFEVTQDAIELLSGYSFPGNIRELKNLLQRALIDFELQARLDGRPAKSRLEACHFDSLIDYGPKTLLTPDEASEKESITALLSEHQFNQSKAARALGIPLSTFNDRVRKYGIEKPRTRSRKT